MFSYQVGLDRGGEDHKTGVADAPSAHLKQRTQTRFPMAAQVIESFDGLAFIGRNPMDHDNVFVATGNSGSGLAHNAITGLLTTGLIDSRKNPWENSTARRTPCPSHALPGAVVTRYLAEQTRGIPPRLAF
jgi:glycine/D-amino acid oxidase-like deaminating enzyme